jgi:hypothetical protein
MSWSGCFLTSLSDEHHKAESLSRNLLEATEVYISSGGAARIPPLEYCDVLSHCIVGISGKKTIFFFRWLDISSREKSKTCCIRLSTTWNRQSS